MKDSEEIAKLRKIKQKLRNYFKNEAEGVKFCNREKNFKLHEKLRNYIKSKKDFAKLGKNSEKNEELLENKLRRNGSKTKK